MNTIIEQQAFNFKLPKQLECVPPTEERGLQRDDTRLLVSHRATNEIHHTTFKNIGDFLEEGDVLIVNTSRTRNAALITELPNGIEGRIHLSTPIEDGKWLVEIRQVKGNDTVRHTTVQTGDRYPLSTGGEVKILEPFYNGTAGTSHIQLWEATFKIPLEINTYLEKFGRPIKYKNVAVSYPLAYYQTAFANQTGSSEMPSAGRGFTTELVTKLVLKGIQIAPIVLHTGVSSLEVDEAPYPEYFEVPDYTAHLINKAKAENRRIIAVGTTAIRAVESAVNPLGTVVPTSGMTNLFITPERGLTVVNGMLTGFHEPKASHLLMMEAIANKQHLAISYQAAIEGEYYWHEFGDLHLIL